MSNIYSPGYFPNEKSKGIDAFYMKKDFEPRTDFHAKDTIENKKVMEEEENKEEIIVEETKKNKKACWKTRLAYTAGSLAATAAVVGGVHAYDTNRPFYSVEDAINNGCTYSQLGINQTIEKRIEEVEKDLKDKTKIREVAKEVADVGIDILISKISSAYEKADLEYYGKDVALRYGRRTPNGIDESYIKIGNELYDREGGENRHKVANEIMVGLDAIIEVQGEIDYTNGPYYDPSRDNDKIYETIEKSMKTLNRTAALVIEFTEDGDIAIVSRKELREKANQDAKKIDDGQEIGD